MLTLSLSDSPAVQTACGAGRTCATAAQVAQVQLTVGANSSCSYANLTVGSLLNYSLHFVPYYRLSPGTTR